MEWMDKPTALGLWLWRNKNSWEFHYGWVLKGPKGLRIGGFPEVDGLGVDLSSSMWDDTRWFGPIPLE